MSDITLEKIYALLENLTNYVTKSLGSTQAFRIMGLIPHVVVDLPHGIHQVVDLVIVVEQVG